MVSDSLVLKINEFKELLVNASSQLSELKAENATLKEKNNELYQTLMSNDDSLSEVKDTESELRQKVKALEYRIEQLVNENRTLNEEIEDKDLQAEEKDEKVGKIQSKLDEFNSKLTELEDELTDKNRKLNNLETNQYHLKKELSEKKVTLLTVDNTITEHKEESAKLKNELYHANQKLEQFPELKKKAKEYDEFIEAAKTDEEEYLKNIADLKQLTHLLEEEHGKEKKMFEASIADKEQQIELLEKKIAVLRDSDTKEAENKTLSEEIAQLQEKLDAKEKEVNDLNDAGYGVLGQTLFGSMNFDDVDVKRESGKVGEMQEKVDKAEFRMKLLVDENQEIKQEVDELKVKKESLEALVKKRYKQIQILEEELSNAIDYKMKTKESRLKLADSLEKYLHKIENIIEN